MLKTCFRLSIIVVIGCIFSLQPAVAGPLISGEVTKVINRVSVIDPAKGDHPASLRDVIKDDLGLQTAEKSRSELLFQDNTLTRIGAETLFSFKTGTRDMTLEKGSMLLQVPKGLGGAKIHTAAVTAAITGTTIMMEYIPRRYIKVLVLEGSLRLSRNGILGDSLVLRPGKMVIMRPDAKKIPDPVDVDLKQIVKTSTLVNFPDSPPLPSMALMQAAIDDQAKDLAKSSLVPTNLVMGHGTGVVLASDDRLAVVAGPISPTKVIASSGSVASTPIVTPTDIGGALPAVTASAPVTPVTTINNLVSSNAGLGLAVNDSLGAIPTTQVVGLLSNAAITPTVLSVGTTVAAIPIGVLSTGLDLGRNTTATLTSLAVSSSTQLLGLLNNAAPAIGGKITITPAALSLGAAIAGVPARVLSTVAGDAVNGATGLPLTLNNVPVISPSPAAPLTPPAVITPNATGALTTATSASGTTAGPLHLGLGH